MFNGTVFGGLKLLYYFAVSLISRSYRMKRYKKFPELTYNLADASGRIETSGQPLVRTEAPLARDAHRIYMLRVYAQ